MLIFDTLLIEVSRETAVSLRDLLSRLRRMGSAFDPRARLLLYRFGAPVLLTAERGHARKAFAIPGPAAPPGSSDGNFVGPAASCSLSVQKLYPTRAHRSFSDFPAAWTPASRQGR